MKNLFLIVLTGLVVFSQFMAFSHPTGVSDGKPVLTWSTGINPVRQEQVEEFYRWLKKNHYPDMTIKLDNASTGMQKFIVQGTSGVASDLNDIFSQNLSSVFYLRQMGLLQSVDDLEKRFGLPDKDVWAPLHSMIYQDGKQVAFPANHAPEGVLVNVEMFRKLGMAPPPFISDLDTFEKIGRDYTTRARQKLGKNYFFLAGVHWEAFRRASALPLFNETMTAPIVDNPRMIALLKRVTRWETEDHITPSAAETQAFTVEQGVMGNATWQIFSRGYFAMMIGNSAALIQLRLMNHSGELSSILPPHDGFPNVIAKTRSIALYTGSQNQDLAKYFLAYLRSDEYNLLVIKQTDAIPPNVSMLNREEFLRPVGHTNEWPLHQGFRTMVQDYAVAKEYSPYVLMPDIDRAEGNAIQAYFSHIITAEEAAKRMNTAFQNEIKRFIDHRPESKAAWTKAMEKQKQIDALKASGQRVPAEMIDNPFTREMVSRSGKLISQL